MITASVAGANDCIVVTANDDSQPSPESCRKAVVTVPYCSCGLAVSGCPFASSDRISLLKTSSDPGTPIDSRDCSHEFSLGCTTHPQRATETRGQASGTGHYIQPKRSRFFLSLAAAPKVLGQIGHDVEQPIFDEALEGLNGTTAMVHRLVGLPRVLAYLIAKAVPGATAPDILRLALAFPETTDGKRYRAAAAVLRKDGVQAQKAKDAAFVAREEAIKMLKPFSRLAEHDGGLHVEVSGMEGPKVALSKELREAGEFVDRLTVAVAPALRDFSCSPAGDSLKSWPN
jgi:hypothetical protein